jgi:hypothetical protein
MPAITKHAVKINAAAKVTPFMNHQTFFDRWLFVLNVAAGRFKNFSQSYAAEKTENHPQISEKTWISF